jgi:hypothetical protein
MSNRHQTQKQLVLEHARKHKFITRYDAAVELGVMNLWARIAELEDEDGYKFDRRRTLSANGKRVLQYWLRNYAKDRKAA